MPRTPTGRPTGRPKGSGLVLTEAEQVRLTVRLERSLYDRLDAYAAGRTYHRGTPQLARCVREALVEYLERREKRQTESLPGPAGECSRQTESMPHALEEISRQTEIGTELLRSDLRQTQSIPRAPGRVRDTTWQTQTVPTAGETTRQTLTVLSRPEASGDDTRQTQTETTPFDTSKYVLGPLCPRRHAYQNTGQTLRRLRSHGCPACDVEQQRERRQAKQHPRRSL
jgi:hypothetical protein